MKDLLTLTKIKNGDVKAFEQVFRLYYMPLCMFAASITGRMDIAEEIVQELFYVFWKERKGTVTIVSYDKKAICMGPCVTNPSSTGNTRMYATVIRDAILSHPDKDDTPDDPQEQIEYKELEALVNRTLEKLPERRLRIFRMHRFEGKKYAEIASNLSLSVKTVEAEMTKALRTLRDELEIYMKYD